MRQTSQDRRTIRTTDVRDVLALIPNQLGFLPTESLVVASLRAPNRRVGLVTRVDLADVSPDLLDALNGHLVRDGADGYFAAYYTERDDLTDVAALMRAHFAFLVETGVYVVTPTTYFPLDDPHNVHDITDLKGSQIAATMAFEGVAVAPTRDTLGHIPPAPKSARTTAARARNHWAGDTQALLDTFRRWCDADGSDTFPSAAQIAGHLAAGMADLHFRDAILVDALGHSDAADRLLCGDSTTVAAALESVLRPGGVRPDTRAERTAAIMEAVVAHATDPSHHAPALTVRAFLAWWDGDGVRANIFVDRALAIDPNHSLACLLSDALAVGMGPGWTR